MHTDEKADLPAGRRGPADDDGLDAQDILRAAIAGLADAPPARPLWPGIARRLETPAPPAAAGAWRVTFTLPQLALAASLLMAVSAGVSWLASRPAVPAAREAAIRAVAEPADRPRPDVERATFADQQYDQAVTDLERILDEERERLDPRTVQVIERNLDAIDAAIGEARAALDRDPANTYLNSHLADARRRKLDLLRRAATWSGL